MSAWELIELAKKSGEAFGEFVGCVIAETLAGTKDYSKCLALLQQKFGGEVRAQGGVQERFPISPGKGLVTPTSTEGKVPPTIRPYELLPGQPGQGQIGKG